MVNYSSPFSSSAPEYYSCPWIEAGLVFGPEALHCCCISHHGNRGWPVLVPNFTGEVFPLEEVLAARRRLIVSNQQSDHDPACRGCPFLQKRRWPPRDYLFDRLNFSHFTTCNLKCFYCWSTQPNFKYKNINVKLLPSLMTLLDKGLLAPRSMILWGGGEPTILPEFESIFSSLAKYGAFQTLNTNGLVLSKVILQWLPVSRFKVVISIDAGTPETYQRIKGVNAFDKVWAHAREYASVGRQQVFAKYIFCDLNLHETNLFVDQVERANLKMVFADVDGRNTSISPEIIAAAGLMSFELRRRGIWFGAMGVGANHLPEEMWTQKVAQAHRRLSRQKPNSLALSEWLGLGKQLYHSVIALKRCGYDPATIRDNIVSTLSNIFR